RRPRSPCKTPEGGDPERSVGPDAGASGFAYFFQEKSKPPLKAEGAGGVAAATGYARNTNTNTSPSPNLLIARNARDETLTISTEK
ncbi:hypothetical protein V0R59_30670, partial [Pseudomonas sp. 147P]